MTTAPSRRCRPTCPASPSIGCSSPASMSSTTRCTGSRTKRAQAALFQILLSPGRRPELELTVWLARHAAVPVRDILRDRARSRAGSCSRRSPARGRPRSSPCSRRSGIAPRLGFCPFLGSEPTLALDFPNRGVETLALMSRLDAIVSEAGGALYPAKDGRMTAANCSGALLSQLGAARSAQGPGDELGFLAKSG